MSAYTVRTRSKLTEILPSSWYRTCSGFSSTVVRTVGQAQPSMQVLFQDFRAPVVLGLFRICMYRDSRDNNKITGDSHNMCGESPWLAVYMYNKI